MNNVNDNVLMDLGFNEIFENPEIESIERAASAHIHLSLLQYLSN